MSALSVFTSIDPLTYGVDGLRGVLGGTSHFPISLDLLVLSVISTILLGVGSYLFSKVQI
jgi:ABC-2 type transport system permease protein